MFENACAWLSVRLEILQDDRRHLLSRVFVIPLLVHHEVLVRQLPSLQALQLQTARSAAFQVLRESIKQLALSSNAAQLCMWTGQHQCNIP